MATNVSLNATDAMASSDVTPATTLVVSILSFITSAVVLFGIACTVEVNNLRGACRSPLPFLVGFASQLICMPALTFAFSKAFGLGKYLTFTMLAIGCVPGGTTSNVLTYFAAGDTALSIALTNVTNILALGTLPLVTALVDPTLPHPPSRALAAPSPTVNVTLSHNVFRTHAPRAARSRSAAQLLHIWISWAGLTIRVPFTSIIISLCIILIPACCGVWLRARNPKCAKIGEKVGAVVGGIVIVSTVLIALLGNQESLSRLDQIMPTGAWLAVCICAPCGMIFAFIALWLSWGLLHLCNTVGGSAACSERAPAVEVACGATACAAISKADSAPSLATSKTTTVSGELSSGVVDVTVVTAEVTDEAKAHEAQAEASAGAAAAEAAASREPDGGGTGGGNRERARMTMGGAPQWATVMLETGVQNMPVALAVVNVTLLTARPRLSADVILSCQIVCGMWTVMTTLFGVVVVFASRWVQSDRCRSRVAG